MFEIRQQQKKDKSKIILQEFLLFFIRFFYILSGCLLCMQVILCRRFMIGDVCTHGKGMECEVFFLSKSGNN